MGIFRKLTESNSIRIEKVRATRAMYINPDMQEVELEIEVEGGEKVTFQCSTRIARELIEQISYAYYAIVPPVKNRREGIGG